MVKVVQLVALLGTGVTAGVFIAVAVSVAPALVALAPEPYVQTHRLLGKGYHPLMPLLVTAALAAEVVLGFVAHPASGRPLYWASAVLLLGVELVSQLCNVPINREVARLDPARLSDWVDPRPEWRNWHYLRTTLALLAVLATGIAVLTGT